MKVIKDIRTELKRHVDLEYKRGSLNFFKEPVKCWGVRAPETRRIGREAYQKIKHLSKTEIFALAEELIASNKNEEAIIGFDWIYRQKNSFIKSDYKFFDKITKNHLTNWVLVDTFCPHAYGELISQYPELIPKIKAYTKSKNRWVRRAASVCFIGQMQKKGDYRKEIFWIADQLLEDPDDLVQKGYGWLLKVTADEYQKDVFDFVMKRKDKMPRTALRYAIEKMPATLKKQAMI